MLIPIITKESKSTLGTVIRTDGGYNMTETLELRGVFHIPCEIHDIWYDCRIGCMECYKARGVPEDED